MNTATQKRALLPKKTLTLQKKVADGDPPAKKSRVWKGNHRTPLLL
jgi:hypothetical protein